MWAKRATDQETVGGRSLSCVPLRQEEAAFHRERSHPRSQWGPPHANEVSKFPQPWLVGIMCSICMGHNAAVLIGWDWSKQETRGSLLIVDSDGGVKQEAKSSSWGFAGVQGAWGATSKRPLDSLHVKSGPLVGHGESVSADKFPIRVCGITAQLHWMLHACGEEKTLLYPSVSFPLV